MQKFKWYLFVSEYFGSKGCMVQNLVAYGAVEQADAIFAN